MEVWFGRLFWSNHCALRLRLLYNTHFLKTVRIRCKHGSLNSHSCRYLHISRRRRCCYSVRWCGTYVSSFVTMPITAKCRDIVWSATERSPPSRRIFGVGRSTFCRKRPTDHPTGLPVPDLWSISISPNAHHLALFFSSTKSSSSQTSPHTQTIKITFRFFLYCFFLSY